MKFYKSFLFLALVFSISFVSCVKDNIDDSDVIEQDPVETVNTTTNNLLANIRGSGDEGLALDCITILYTFEMTLLDGEEVSIASEADFWSLFEDSTNVIVDFVYPLDVLDDDEQEQTVNDAVELGELFIACVPDTGWVENDNLVPAFFFDETCFQLVFPVELVDEAGIVYTAENIEEFIDLISSQDLLFFNWPLNLVDEDGVFYIVESADSFFELMFSCENYGNPCDSVWNGEDSIFFGAQYLGCYEIVFPVSVIDENGDVIEIEDVDQMMSLVFNGFFIVDFVYPFNIIDEEGVVHTVTDAFHLNELMDECWGGPNGGGGFEQLLILFSTAVMGDEACYSINYPITISNGDSLLVDINNDEEMMNLFEHSEYYSFQYPISVTLLEDQSIYTVNDEEDIAMLIETCEGNTGGFNDDLLFIFSTAIMGDSACYSISYPIDAELMDSSLLEISSDIEYITLNQTEEWYWIQYPITIILNDNTEVILEQQEDLFEVINDCQ